jgi:hypothetical protein
MTMTKTPGPSNEFTKESERGRRTLASEVWEFLSANKKWWMLPIIVVFAFFGLLMLIGGTAAAPFIYSLF